MPSGAFYRRVNGFHHGTIYDIDWSPDDNLLMSASNDCTVQVWSTIKEKLPAVVLPHPCFIYSCKFCPINEYQNLVFTGAVDGMIRIWSVRKCFSESMSHSAKDPELMREFDAMQGQVLSLAFKFISPPVLTSAHDAANPTVSIVTPPSVTTSSFHLNNNSIKASSRSSFKSKNTKPAVLSATARNPKIDLILFASGSNGTITTWRHSNENMVILDPANWVQTGKIRVPELRNIPVNLIEISPIGTLILLCCRDGLLRMIDYERYLSFLFLFSIFSDQYSTPFVCRETIVQSYPGSQNFSHLIRGTLSPCGRYVFNGSEDGIAYVWAAETGENFARH